MVTDTESCQARVRLLPQPFWENLKDTNTHTHTHTHGKKHLALPPSISSHTHTHTYSFLRSMLSHRMWLDIAAAIRQCGIPVWSHRFETLKAHISFFLQASTHYRAPVICFSLINWMSHMYRKNWIKWEKKLIFIYNLKKIVFTVYLLFLFF